MGAYYIPEVSYHVLITFRYAKAPSQFSLHIKLTEGQLDFESGNWHTFESTLSVESVLAACAISH